MLITGNSIISDDIKDRHFCCNIEKCKGMCCVEGDFGAPITKEEKKDYQTSASADYASASAKSTTGY